MIEGYFTVINISFEELKLSLQGNFKIKSIYRIAMGHGSVYRHKKNILLVLIQTEMWNNYRDGKLAKQIMEGASWMIGQSVLT